MGTIGRQIQYLVFFSEFFLIGHNLVNIDHIKMNLTFRKKLFKKIPMQFLVLILNYPHGTAKFEISTDIVPEHCCALD